MKLYYVRYGGRIAGSADATYIMAESEMDALTKAKKLLDTHKLAPDFLNSYGHFTVTEV